MDNDAQAIIDAAKRYGAHSPSSISTAQIRRSFCPKGEGRIASRASSTNMPARPTADAGTSSHHDFTSFIDHVNAFKDEHRAIFADPGRNVGRPAIDRRL